MTVVGIFPALAADGKMRSRAPVNTKLDGNFTVKAQVCPDDDALERLFCVFV